MAEKRNPINETDDEARALARRLIDEARTGALAVLHPDTGAPFVSRVAVGTDADGAPVTLISALAVHTRALRSDTRAALLLGDPGLKGDPLTHPRITLSVTAQFLDPADPDREALRARWLETHPKSQLYVDFPDFAFVRLQVWGAALNGGFGKAYELTPAELMP
ncbi:HugZ family protein [Ostreiculturibacter nitratireducens]|uniref:HugZ family pyridoxamine 5'-phosphate oxidase n=1 Tax=Ostreiculturibacter nitratireducens TaxID=3075226 RepID=UPI0031B60FE8